MNIITQNGDNFYITTEDDIEFGDNILYKLGKHKDYPFTFGKCLGFDKEGFIMIHDDMSIDKAQCLKLKAIEFVKSITID